MIDLNAPHNNNIRCIDHRSIDFIILKNTKYELGKGTKAVEEDKKAEDKIKWDPSKLAVGDWYSLTQYYKVKDIEKENVQVKSHGGKELVISKDILQHEMHSGMAFEKTEKLPMTKMANVLLSTKDSVFTICFQKKIDSKDVKEALIHAKPVDFKNESKAKALVKDLLSGQEHTMTAKLHKFEPKLGRSLCFDLNMPHNCGWRWVDHRTVQWMIINSVKYVLTK